MWRSGVLWDCCSATLLRRFDCETSDDDRHNRGHDCVFNGCLSVSIARWKIIISDPSSSRRRGRPDLNGVWDHAFVQNMEVDGRDQKGTGPLPFTPEGAAIFSFDAANYDYTGRCLPLGLTRSMNSPMPIQIVQTNKDVVFLFEA